MNVSIYQAASAMDAHAKWHEVIAGNLSASSVPGFKKADLRFTANEGGAIPGSIGPDGIKKFTLPNAEVSYDLSPGHLAKTSVHTDLAIGSDGFFEVALPSGESAYTRDGEFSMNQEGYLVTKQGYQVIGDAGPIQFDTPGKFEVSNSGQITQGGNEIGNNLRIVSFPKASDLSPIGNGIFSKSKPQLEPEAIEQPIFRQGYIEKSNVSTIEEMTKLIQVTRAYESNQRVIQNHDRRTERTLQELGQPV